MAKWGEGDPRWIVEERPDATNVNNWHWVEKNATAWSKDKLRELLDGLAIEDENILCKVKEVSKIEGEATANNRKGRLIFFYEWVISANWEGRLKSGLEDVKGTIDIPNLSEENEADEVDVNITTQQSSDEAYIVKEFMRISGSSILHKQLATYIHCLKEEYGRGIILPTKTSGKTQVKDVTIQATGSNVKEEFRKMTVNNSVSSPAPTSRCTKTLFTTEEFKCSGHELYRALTDQAMVQAYAGHDSSIDARVGGSFSLFGGNITGQIVELALDKKIVSNWRLKAWPTEHHSVVTITITEGDDGTKLVLQQAGIPEHEYEKTMDGWIQNYWGRIRSVFGFGARIL